MNRDDDFIARLEDYLEVVEGVTPLPDRVRDAVHVDLPVTPQARPRRGLERMLDMVSRASTPARLGLAAAVAVAFVVVGAAVVNNDRSSPAVGAATAPPSPSVLPSASSAVITPLFQASPVPCRPGDTGTGCLPAGTYQLSGDSWPGRITVDVPAGWFEYYAALDFDGVLVDSGPTAADGSGWGVVFMTLGPVSKDPCDSSKGTFDPAATATVDGLVAAMSGWPGFKASTPVPTTVDGHSGKLIELTSTRTTTDCPDPVLWRTPRSGLLDGYSVVGVPAASHAAQFRIVDVDGTLLVIRTTDYPQPSPFELQQGVTPDPNLHAADQVALHKILDSIRVTPTGP